MKKELLDAEDKAEREGNEKATAQRVARQENFLKTQKMNYKVDKFQNICEDYEEEIDYKNNKIIGLKQVIDDQIVQIQEVESNNKKEPKEMTQIQMQF